MSISSSIFFNTGANTLCSNNKNILKSVTPPQPSGGAIETANGGQSLSAGSGKIGRRNAQFTPDFSYSLVPVEDVSDTRVSIIMDDVAHFVTDSTREILSDIINQTSAPNKV